ncbi:MAG TPA: carbon-nitrogen hydrolase family protein [Actinophytocola sp.]|uniref:carbon-nitrogen hydrolase family protein n=1 Tax=Actinophytocola sp. TaxID=1872138 RepID=UPI002DBC034E|nr:carbon-nitrogen hydrolase family protein [Actinophytocola sp.]HEU5474525.1 carbon-nitrogen hydrolase family protein [Actinophytocola sp.]
MRVALCQITATEDPGANLAEVQSSVARAAAEGASVVLFPEATMARFGVPLGPIAEPLDGPWATAVRGIAADHDVLVLAGMFTPAPDGRVYNTQLITGRGQHLGYDKIHLFDAFGFEESKTVAPGHSPVTVPLDGTVLGVATCYDIRFPALFTALADQGAAVILLGASWGAGEGKLAQWELLVRARALDSTCWVLACGQADPHVPDPKAPTGIGYSTVADPLGRVHAQAGPDPDMLVVDVDTELVAHTRRTIPVLANRRL